MLNDKVIQYSVRRKPLAALYRMFNKWLGRGGGYIEQDGNYYRYETRRYLIMYSGWNGERDGKVSYQECHVEVINKMRDSGLNIQVEESKNHHGTR